MSAVAVSALLTLAVDASGYAMARAARLSAAGGLSRWCLPCAAANGAYGILAAVLTGPGYAAGGGLASLVTLASWWLSRGGRWHRVLAALVWRARDVAVPHPGPGGGR